MIDIYKYYINFNDGNGSVETTIYNNALNIVHRRNEDYIGIVDYFLEGAFVLVGNDFDKALESFKTDGSISLDIQMNSISILTTTCFDLCNLDYKSRSATVKNFLKWPENSIRNIWKKTFIFPHADIVELFEDYIKITDFAYDLMDLIKAKIISLHVYESFDRDDYWFDTGLSTIDFDDLRIAEMSYMIETGGTLVGGGRQSTSLKRLFDLLCTFFNITITIENDQIYFKKHTDFIDNSLDVTNEYSEIKVRNYDLNKIYSEFILKFSENNYLDDDEDYVEANSLFNYAGEVLEADLKEFTTDWTYTSGLSGSGFFVGYVDGSNTLIVGTGYISGVNKDNIDLSPANLLDTYYRDFINTDKKYFSICGNASASAPSYFKDFIEIPDIHTVINSPDVFYDSLILETIGATNRIGLVTEQKTNLLTNITTFTAFEFYNDIDV